MPYREAAPGDTVFQRSRFQRWWRSTRVKCLTAWSGRIARRLTPCCGVPYGVPERGGRKKSPHMRGYCSSCRCIWMSW